VTCFLNFVYGVDYGGVVLSAEGSTDLRQGGIGEFLDEVHGYLPWVNHLLGIALLLEMGLLDLEALGDGFLDGIHGHTAILDVHQVL